MATGRFPFKPRGWKRSILKRSRKCRGGRSQNVWTCLFFKQLHFALSLLWMHRKEETSLFFVLNGRKVFFFDSAANCRRVVKQMTRENVLFCRKSHTQWRRLAKSVLANMSPSRSRTKGGWSLKFFSDCRNHLRTVNRTPPSPWLHKKPIFLLPPRPLPLKFQKKKKKTRRKKL